MTAPRSLPAFVPVSEVRSRLERLFPETFPDRGLLVGEMAARVVFVFLYGGFVAPDGPLLRPSFIYLFTERQARKSADADRDLWRTQAARPGYRPAGKRWYADNSRESIRDDLMRNRLVRLGVVQRRAGEPTTASRPTYSLSEDFARLFGPDLAGEALERELDAWRSRRLDAGVLSRMRLRAQGFAAHASDVLVDLPDGTRIRLKAGPSSVILKAIIEHFAPRYLRQPAVLWISASDKPTWPQFAQAARHIGLHFSPSAELPDLILADLDESTSVRFVFCEVVATGGAVTAGRREALLRIVQASELPIDRVEFLSAFEDREAAPFRKSFSSLATEGMAWFRTEPDLVVRLQRLG